MSDFKFGWKPEEPQRYEYPNIWSREKTTRQERLVIAPTSDHIALMNYRVSCLNPSEFCMS
jgi:hypothetical protein